ncbi:MAG TPA: hypothetical protein VL069_01215, partial [Opitutus sp.]|nr:hypothetical protein [Opitutus sp.]
RVAVVSVFVALLPLAMIVAASIERGISPGLLTRDPTSLGGIHPLSGALSNTGVLLWWSSATLWFGSAFVLRNARTRGSYRFAISSGLLSAYLALDDLFQFHDIVAPEYMGIPEDIIYLMLAITVAAYFVVFWRQILRPDGSLLVLAFALLAASVVLDTVLEPVLMKLGRWLVLFEDGAKWLGITSWFAFCVVRCRTEVSWGCSRPSPESNRVL